MPADPTAMSDGDLLAAATEAWALELRRTRSGPPALRWDDLWIECRRRGRPDIWRDAHAAARAQRLEQDRRNREGT